MCEIIDLDYLFERKQKNVTTMDEFLLFKQIEKDKNLNVNQQIALYYKLIKNERLLNRILENYNV